MDDAPAPLSTELTADGVLVARLDDGRANAIGHPTIDALHEAMDRAEADATALALVGRPGRFSAGFDLEVMRQGPAPARALVAAGAELALRLYELPRPVVVGCTGHALAMGAIVLMAADIRVGAAGAFKIGLNEVAIGMPVPLFAVELARDRLCPRHRTAAVNLARIYGPEGAVEAGYLDEVVMADEVESASLARAAELGAGVVPSAFATTRANLRAGVAATIRAVSDADIARFTVDA